MYAKLLIALLLSTFTVSFSFQYRTSGGIGLVSRAGSVNDYYNGRGGSQMENGEKMPCNKNMERYFNSDASIDLSFDSFMNEVLADVLYLELLNKQQQQQQKREQKRTVLLLNNPTQVSGNTYRFTIGSQSSQLSQGMRYWQETETFYLCKNKKCRETERFEMVSVSNNYSPKSGKFNAHLVPTTTLAPLINENNNNNNNNNDNNVDEGNNVISFELDDSTSDSSTSSTDNYDESQDLIVIEITSIIILIIVCGVGYALFRCVVDRRDAQRELKILMSPTGLALLENEVKNEKGNKMSTNTKTLNDTFEQGPDGNTQYKLFHTDG